jgi:predicted RNA-binding Zn-ribbon protein involved in translation (DUF1610 family)
MTGHPHCPACGGAAVRRAVTTYEYLTPSWVDRLTAARRACGQTDTYYCAGCGHTWDERAATAD